MNDRLTELETICDNYKHQINLILPAKFTNYGPQSEQVHDTDLLVKIGSMISLISACEQSLQAIRYYQKTLNQTDE